jgi:hypothetical protein
MKKVILVGLAAGSGRAAREPATDSPSPRGRKQRKQMRKFIVGGFAAVGAALAGVSRQSGRSARTGRSCTEG